MDKNADILLRMNNYLEKFNDIEILPIDEPDVFFIIGAPRCGSTLIYQSLAQSLEFAFPNNFIARFWGHPIIGYVLYQQIYGINEFYSTFTSHHGYSEKSVHEPHEFGYFWSRWFDHSHSHYTPATCFISSELKKVLGRLQRLSEIPWLFKNLTLGLKITAIKNLLPKAKFIVVVREPANIAFSLLKGRQDRFGDKSVWWSLKPKEIDQIKNFSAEKQVASQVYYCYRQIYSDIKELPSSEYYIIRYEEFCESPNNVVQKLADFWNLEKKRDLPCNFSQKKHEISGRILSETEYYFNKPDIFWPMNGYNDR